MDKQKKLYRSRTDKVFAGIAGGMGKYLEMDTTLIRVLFVLLFFMSGFFPFVLLYIVLAFVIPMEPVQQGPDKENP